MSLFFQNRKQVYCAFCKNPRMVYKKRHVGFFDISSSFLMAATLIAAVYQQFHYYFFILWVFFLCVSELFIQIRWRINIVCKFCGFDPVLYLKNPLDCAQKVKLKLESRKEDPSYYLGSVSANLPKISSKRKKELEDLEKTMYARKNSDSKKGVLISKVL